MEQTITSIVAAAAVEAGCCYRPFVSIVAAMLEFGHDFDEAFGEYVDFWGIPSDDELYAAMVERLRNSGVHDGPKLYCSRLCLKVRAKMGEVKGLAH